MAELTGDPLAGLSEIDAATVVRCARVLLRRPLLRADGPDGDMLPLVYRHRAALQELFAGLLGYRLVVARRFARLYKAGPGADATRGEPGMSPRAYAYVALTVAALTGLGRQVLLSRVVTEVHAAAVQAGMTGLDDVADRRALTSALRHLIALGVLTETDGTVGAALGNGPSEALITIDTDLLGHLLAGPIGEASGPDELVEHAAATARVEHSVRRRLVEDPVVLPADLPPASAEWLLRRRRRESALLERCFGLVTETRAEGIAVTDPEGYLTDVVFPGPGTVARIAMLALPELLAFDQSEKDLFDGDVNHPSGKDGRIVVSDARVLDVCARLVADYPSAWSKQATDDMDGLVGQVIALLRSLGLATRAGGDRWLISPAAHRWQPNADDTPSRRTDQYPASSPVDVHSEWSLFDGEEARW